MRTAVLILAGGAASRMQQPKMLLPFGDKTLLERILEEALSVYPSSMYVITGYYHDAIAAAIGTGKAKLLYNEYWEEGMATTIRKGISALKEESVIPDAVIMAVSDQPFLDAVLLQQLVNTHIETGKGIIAAEYRGIKGTPVFFRNSYFDRLLQLKGDTGARTLIKTLAKEVATVPFPGGAMDIDTPEDYRMALSSYLAANADRQTPSDPQLPPHITHRPL